MHYIVVLLTISSVLAAGAFLFIAIRRDSQGVRNLSLAVLSIFFYVVGSLFEATATNADSINRSVVLEYIGLPFIAPNVLLFMIRFYGRKMNRYLPAGLFVLPFVFSAAAVTNSTHHLFHGNPAYSIHQPLSRLLFSPTPLYVLSVGYTLLLLLASLSILVLEMRKRRGKRQTRERILFTALSLPIISNFLYLFGLTPGRLDFTPIVLTVTSGLVVLAAQRHNLLQLLPIAASAIVENLADPVILVDPRCNFLKSNRAAKNLYPVLETLDVGE